MTHLVLVLLSLLISSSSQQLTLIESSPPWDFGSSASSQSAITDGVSQVVNITMKITSAGAIHSVMVVGSNGVAKSRAPVYNSSCPEPTQKSITFSSV